MRYSAADGMPSLPECGDGSAPIFLFPDDAELPLFPDPVHGGERHFPARRVLGQSFAPGSVPAAPGRPEGAVWDFWQPAPPPERCAEELRVSELAASFYMEQNSLIRRFKGYTGKTPKEYQITCRMERATALLLGSDLSLSEIAARCGFPSHSFFTKTFKRLTTMTPREFKNSIL